MRSGIVIGAFVHEATDEAWKKFDRGVENDAHFGILGKAAESDLRQFFIRNRDFGALVLPADDAPDTLVNAAWQCLYGSYTRNHPSDYGYAMAYANRAILLYQDEARKQQAELASYKSPPEVAANPKFWALNSVGTGYFIIGDAWMLMSFDFRGGERRAKSLASGRFSSRITGSPIPSFQIRPMAKLFRRTPTTASILRGKFLRATPHAVFLRATARSGRNLSAVSKSDSARFPGDAAAVYSADVEKLRDFHRALSGGDFGIRLALRPSRRESFGQNQIHLKAGREISIRPGAGLQSGRASSGL